VAGVGLARRSACRITLILAGLFIRIGIAAAAALDAIEFAARREVLALVTTGQMSIYIEMNNHQTPPS
jgi:hypothetical protein